MAFFVRQKVYKLKSTIIFDKNKNFFFKFHFPYKNKKQKFVKK